MKKLLCSAALVALAAPSASAQDDLTLDDLLDLDTLTHVIIDAAVLTLRSQVDLTYEGLSVSRGGNEISLTGVRLYPVVDWDMEGLCEVVIDRLDLSTAGGLGESNLHLEAIGAELTPACLEPEAQEGLTAAGYTTLEADRFFMDFAYQIGSSELDLSGHLALRDAAVFDLTAHFDYFWFRDTGYGEPDPAMLLSSGVLSVEDRGLLDRLRPILPPEALDPAQAPMLMAQGLEMELSQGGTRQVTPEDRAFLASMAKGIGEFLKGAGRISLVAEPAEPVWLTPDSLGGPGDLIALLRPAVVAGAAPGAAAAVPLDLLTAASGGAALAPADARRVGLALLTGEGAPFAPALGRQVLEPVAAGDAGVQIALARSWADEDAEIAYAWALDAAASGADGALAVLDGAEAGLGAEAILRLQGDDRAAAVEAATGASDLRDAALRALAGVGQRRSYRDAYVLASLAAAAGDLSSGALRARIDRRMAAHDTDGAWAGTMRTLDDEVMGVWTGLLGPRFAAPARRGFGGWGNSNN